MMAARFSWASASAGAQSDGPPVAKLHQMGEVEFPRALRGLGLGQAVKKRHRNEEEV
jgi:hypothetical protein